MDLSKEFLDLQKISDEYIKPDPGRIVDKKLLSLIVSEIIPLISGSNVLEMGFGDDQWTSKIIEKVEHTHIVDASSILLETCKEKYKDAVTCYESFFEEFTPEKKFDTIIASYILEHVEDPVLVLSKAIEWLKDDGTLIAIVPHAGSLHRRLAVEMGIQKEVSDLGDTDFQMGHRRVYSLTAFENDITKAGYNIVDKIGLNIKLLPQGMMTQFSDEMLVGLMKLSKNLPIEYSSAIAFICKK